MREFLKHWGISVVVAVIFGAAGAGLIIYNASRADEAKRSKEVARVLVRDNYAEDWTGRMKGIGTVKGPDVEARMFRSGKLCAVFLHQTRHPKYPYTAVEFGGEIGLRFLHFPTEEAALQEARNWCNRPKEKP